MFPPLSEGRTSRGFDEAAAVAQRLGAHPSVLTIHEWGHAHDGRPWIVTEPQPAESVDTLLTMDGPLGVERALQVGVLLAGALETAHRAGIVHGDLQPARLVFGAHGEPLLVETGLAAFAVFPGLGALNNPVRYFAPPEVLERTDTTTATDVYSLGTTVYAMLAGRAPQQKPAEITDSNASLLLRILQMPVPPIDRPDLPAGLLDALRGALSPSPARRPQRAIDVAWMLQDVQRNAGFAVTEPVVLDLDAGGTRVEAQVRATAGAGGSPLAPAAHPAQADAVRSPAVAPDHAGATPLADPWAPSDAPADPWGPSAVPADAPADPWGPSATPDDASADPWGPSAVPADAPADPWGPSAVPAGPPPDFPDEVVPPPTIFPFAEGLDDMPDRRSAAPMATSWPDAPEADTSDSGAAEQSLWSPPPTEGATEQSLWPSSWPADHAQGELPSWAAPSPGDSGDPRAGATPAGGLAGPVGDLAPTGLNGNGNGNGAAGNGAAVDHGLVAPDRPAAPAAPSAPSEPGSRAVLPPELDELPSWYTDPLPNEGARGGTNGADPSSAGAAHGAPWS
ncbi:MAG: protein kinase, partial [Acidimicrobiales bacterium]|nr:protein kinase [Acidimicrobiales bacterium]